MKKKLDRKKVLLYVILKAGGIGGITRLQKYLFLLQEEKDVPLKYTFHPYELGPYSLELRYEDLAKLISLGFVTESIVNIVEVQRHDYSLSKYGEAYTSSIVEKELTPSVKQKISKIINTWDKKGLDQLLNYVHKKWPEYRQLSVKVRNLEEIPF